jgi:hypothetical protein
MLDQLLQGSGKPPRMASPGEVRIAREASEKSPDLMHFVVVPAGFNAKGLAGIRLNLPKAAQHLIEVIRDDDDLAVGDTNEFVCIGRLGISPGLCIYLAGKLTVEVSQAAGTRHGMYLL